MENNPSAREWTGTQLQNILKLGHDAGMTCLISYGLVGDYKALEKSINQSSQWKLLFFKIPLRWHPFPLILSNEREEGSPMTNGSYWSNTKGCLRSGERWASSSWFQCSAQSEKLLQ